MSVVDQSAGISDVVVARLRHDLLNPLNVLFGMTSVLLESELTEAQRTSVQACRNAAQQLLEIAKRLETYRQPQSAIDGPTQLADLCSIAAARVDKPFDRETLLSVIQRLAPVPAPRILLVDDAPDIALLVRAYLKDTKCSIDVVADGERAVAQASSQPYDLVLMDVDLPGLDGATAAHAIRVTDLARGAKPTPVVAMSAVASRFATDSAGVLPEPPLHGDVVTLHDPDTAPLAPTFLQNRREDVETMRALIEAAEFGRVQSIGHKMKGTGTSYGFPIISRIGAQIELAAHQNDAAALERLVKDLEEYLRCVKVRDS
jgi:CheY-like chemotaxis protein/HPt (histidine-containing phosphotransfer) domain-containing protein